MSNRIISKLDEAAMTSHMNALEMARKARSRKPEAPKKKEKEEKKPDNSKVQSEGTGIHGRFGIGLL